MLINKVNKSLLYTSVIKSKGQLKFYTQTFQKLEFESNKAPASHNGGLNSNLKMGHEHLGCLGNVVSAASDLLHQ